jgi:pyruvate,water dikinase
VQVVTAGAVRRRRLVDAHLVAEVVFSIISGVIVETGGLLSHSSCLAREYGFPAAQVEGAVRLIPDGAKITLNGDSGEVHLIEEDQAREEQVAAIA